VCEREDMSADSEDDELSCVMGGESEGDCMYLDNLAKFIRRFIP